MSRDDILKMEAGQAMDSLVAEKVMGWKRAHMDYMFWQPTAAEILLRFCSPELTPYENTEINYSRAFHPSYDIAAAFEVLSKFGEVSWSLSPCWSLGTGKRIGFSFWIDGETTIAETAPLAICRAALLAVMEVKS
jgi:hypothetical protein